MTIEKEKQEAQYNSAAGIPDEPKAQDTLQSDAEGTDSEATGFDGGGCNSEIDAQSNANEAAGDETIAR